jgi:hypothetical protein
VHVLITTITASVAAIVPGSCAKYIRHGAPGQLGQWQKQADGTGRAGQGLIRRPQPGEGGVSGDDLLQVR